MTMANTTRRRGLRTLYLGLGAGVVYALMYTVTLFHIEVLSGLRPLDMRPLGYSIADIEALFSALGTSGRHYYLSRQIPLDLIYPALLALTLVSFFNLTASRGTAPRLGRWGTGIAIAAALADYAENAGIVTLIFNWPNLSPILAKATSGASVAKAGLTTVASTMALLSGILFAYQTVQRR